MEATLRILPQKKVLVYTRNFTNRLIHWVTFFSVITLMITGYYIGNPILIFGQGEPYNTFTMANIRYYHFIAAMFLDVALMLWVYLAFMSHHHRYWKEMIPTPTVLRDAAQVAKSYFTHVKPPFYRHFDPLDGLLFLLLIIMMAMQLITGFQIYVVGLPVDYWWSKFIHLTTDWVEIIFGSHQGVRTAHHFVQWVMLAGIIIHVHLQIIKTVIWKDGHIGQIVGGYKYRDME